MRESNACGILVFIFLCFSSSAFALSKAQEERVKKAGAVIKKIADSARSCEYAMRFKDQYEECDDVYLFFDNFELQGALSFLSKTAEDLIGTDDSIYYLKKIDEYHNDYKYILEVSDMIAVFAKTGRYLPPKERELFKKNKNCKEEENLRWVNGEFICGN